jgi:CubicO group peptidase (beta-lactamase class C family)
MRAASVVLLLCVACVSRAADLPRSAPEEQGISSAAISNFIVEADKIDSLHSFMLVRHGHVVAEGWWGPYNKDSRHMLFSLSKSFTSTAVGLAIAEGKLSLDDEVLKAFPDDAPAEPSANLKNMRLSDLLRMSTGHQTEPPRSGSDPWTKTFLAHPVPFKPGTHFQYNTSATYMQSAMVQKATGQTLLDYLRPRLFEPLDIKDPTWELSPQGISTGGYGLSIRTEDIAKFGQLYLQNGKWNGKQLVPAEWVAAATARQTSNGSNPKSDWDQGYGYQFWRCRHGAYRGDGAFGQYCIVLPEQDAVIAITSGLRDMQSVLNLIWDKLLPEFKSAALTKDEVAAANLQKTLQGLMLRLPTGSASASSAVGKKFVFPSNSQKLESLALREGKDGAITLDLFVGGDKQQIQCGAGKWLNDKFAWGPIATQPAAAAGAWTAEDTYTAKLCFYETPFVVTLDMKFKGDEVRLSSQSNVGFGSTKGLDLIGKAAE